MNSDQLPTSSGAAASSCAATSGTSNGVLQLLLSSNVNYQHQLQKLIELLQDELYVIREKITAKEDQLREYQNRALRNPQSPVAKSPFWRFEYPYFKIPGRWETDQPVFRTETAVLEAYHGVLRPNAGRPEPWSPMDDENLTQAIKEVLNGVQIFEFSVGLEIDWLSVAATMGYKFAPQQCFRRWYFTRCPSVKHGQFTADESLQLANLATADSIDWEEQAAKMNRHPFPVFERFAELTVQRPGGPVAWSASEDEQLLLIIYQLDMDAQFSTVSTVDFTRVRYFLDKLVTLDELRQRVSVLLHGFGGVERFPSGRLRSHPVTRRSQYGQRWVPREDEIVNEMISSLPTTCIATSVDSLDCAIKLPGRTFKAVLGRAPVVAASQFKIHNPYHFLIVWWLWDLKLGYSVQLTQLFRYFNPENPYKYMVDVFRCVSGLKQRKNTWINASSVEDLAQKVVYAWLVDVCIARSKEESSKVAKNIDFCAAAISDPTVLWDAEPVLERDVICAVLSGEGIVFDRKKGTLPSEQIPELADKILRIVQRAKRVTRLALPENAEVFERMKRSRESTDAIPDSRLDEALPSALFGKLALCHGAQSALRDAFRNDVLLPPTISSILLLSRILGNEDLRKSIKPISSEDAEKVDEGSEEFEQHAGKVDTRDTGIRRIASSYPGFDVFRRRLSLVLMWPVLLSSSRPDL